MCLSQFLGDLSPFQVLINAFALITGTITIYKLYFERASVKAYPTDRVSFVISKDGGTSNIQLGINLVNTSIKTGTVQSLEMTVTTPNREAYNFEWILFYAYSPGGYQVQKESDPYPVAVSGKNSNLKFVQFVIIPSRIPAWPAGRYEFKIVGWVNKNQRKDKSNLVSIFHVDLPEETALSLKNERPQNPTAVSARVVEWSMSARSLS